MKKYLISLAILFFAVSALAAGSKSVTPSVSKDVQHYNEGVALMLDKEFGEAEKNFRKAIEANDKFAEAHNNLAYTLRKQGPENFDEALEHYNRAIRLNPTLAEPYMYRGVLFVQMGNRTSALQDHQVLVQMKSPLADELKFVVVNGREKEPEQFFGVSREMN